MSPDDARVSRRRRVRDRVWDNCVGTAECTTERAAPMTRHAKDTEVFRQVRKAPSPTDRVGPLMYSRRMRPFGRSFGMVVPICALVISAYACKPSNPPVSEEEVPRGGSAGMVSSSGGAGTGGSIPIASGGNAGTLVVGGMTGNGGGSGGIVECAGDRVMGEPVPVDVYVMLDISGSMLDASGGTTTKWDAVKSALGTFFNDPGSAGLSVAIQYFPLRVPGLPESCASDADCGAAAPCLLNICSKLDEALIQCVPGADPIDKAACTNAIISDDGPCEAGVCRLSGAACADAAACQRIEPMGNYCTAIGHCDMDPTLSCPLPGTAPIDDACGQFGLGTCVADTTHFCAHETVCDPASYQAPAVEFAELPGSAAALTASIAAQAPLGDTPSRSALRGAIAHAREWGAGHAGHSVVVVLATDGLPTECAGGRGITGTTTKALDDTVAVATEGFSGASSIQTFVIGVFAATETDAQTNLDRIAVAGGTKNAYVITYGTDASSNVQEQFGAALNEIRAGRLGCEFQIPQPASGSVLDYSEVNVELTDAQQMKKTLYYVAPTGCTGATDEWHYDVAPTSSASPTKIIACPETCTALKATANASVGIQLGCAQIIR